MIFRNRLQYLLIALVLSAFIQNVRAGWGRMARKESGEHVEHFRKIEQIQDMQNTLLPVGSDKLYRVFRETNPGVPDESQRVWREVKLLRNLFVAKLWNGKKLKMPSFYHLGLIIADEKYVEGEYSTYGYQLTERYGEHYMHRERDFLPRIDQGDPVMLKKRPKLKIKSVCFTDRTHDEIFAHMSNFEGGFSKLARNCVDVAHFMLEYVCGEQIAHLETAKYRNPISSIAKGINYGYEGVWKQSRRHEHLKVKDVEEEARDLKAHAARRELAG